MKISSTLFTTMVLLVLTQAAGRAQTVAAVSGGNTTLPAPAASSISTPAAAPAASAMPAPTSQAVSSGKPLNATDAFNAGVSAYDAGDYVKARDQFMAAENTAVSPALEYNLGNAFFQNSDYGQAVLHYLRSLSLDPSNPDARQNLSMAWQAASVAVPEPTYLDHLASYLSLNRWTLVFTICGWAALYLLFLPKLYRWRGATPWLLCAAAFIFAAMAATAFYGLSLHAHDGVVLHADTPLKISPSENSKPSGLLQPGEVAEILNRHGSYYNVRTADGRAGWVQDTNYAPVWN